MIDDIVCGSCEEKLLKERVSREKFLEKQENKEQKKAEINKKIKTIFKKLKKDVFAKKNSQVEKQEEKIERVLQHFFEREKNEEDSKGKEEVTLKALQSKKEFIEFVNSRLKERKSSEVFEVSSDKFNGIIFHAFSKNFSVRKMWNNAEMGHFEGLVNVDKTSDEKRYYFNFAYLIRKDKQRIEMGDFIDYPPRDVFFGYVINEKNEVEFIREEFRKGEKSLVMDIYNKSENVMKKIYINVLKSKAKPEELTL